MRYYTNKYICQIADQASVTSPIEREDSGVSACPFVDERALAVFKEDVMGIVNQHYIDAKLREESAQLVQFCHDIKKLLVEEVDSVRDIRSPYCDWSDMHVNFDDVLDFVEEQGNFTEEDRFTACQMVVDILCLESCEEVLKQDFLNYAFCRILYMYGAQESCLFDPYESRKIADLLLEKNCYAPYKLIAVVHLAALETAAFKRKQLLDSCFGIIRDIQESEPEYKRWFGLSLVVLLFLGGDNYSLLSDEQRDFIQLILNEFDSIMTIDVYEAEEYSETLVGLEPMSEQFFYEYTYSVLLSEFHSIMPWSSCRGAASEHYFIFDLIKCVQFVYTYATFVLDGPLRAYEIMGFLDSEPYVSDLTLKYDRRLIDAIIREKGKATYQQSPEHKALADQAQVGAKLDVISDQLGTMQDALSIILSKVENISDFGDRLEEVISSLFKGEAEKLESVIRASGGTPQLDAIEDVIKNQLGECWDKTSDDAKKAILTAIYSLNTMPEDGFFDARGVIICACVALEHELDIVFHHGWYSYLEKNYSHPDQLIFWPSKWCEYDEDENEQLIRIAYRHFDDTHFSLGSMPYLFGWNAKWSEYRPAKNKYRGYSIPIEDYIKQLFEVDDPYDWFTEDDGILSEIDIVRQDFRNPAAHSEPITREQAKKCMEFTLGVSLGNDSIDTDALFWRILDVKK